MPWFGETTLRQRHDLPELLDNLDMDHHTMLGNLRDIRRFNRLLRWDAMVANDALRLIGDQDSSYRPTILDVGCGTGDLPLAVGARMRRAGYESRFICVDIHQPVLAAARHHIGAALSCDYLRADGLRLPLPNRAIDLVLCSATLHHFPPREAVRLLGELARVTRGALLVNDLARGWGPYLGARVITAIAMRNRVTRHDGVVSVRRAYTPREVRGLALTAGLVGADVRSRLPGRLTLTWLPTTAHPAPPGAAARG
ncbi:MAG TPA: methyltransferase domain-containing protein [Thermomicrobiales bacterium]|jgi:SAM-dependent methyltransferase